MRTRRGLWNVVMLGAIGATAALLAPKVSRADDVAVRPILRAPGVKVSDLAGSWAISLGGNTGCGLSSMYATVDLDATGKGTAQVRGSSTGCPPSFDPAEPFQILSLNPDGSGTAGLACGPSCGWVFTIQVPDQATNLFTLVDVAADNPNNVLVGTAARKWPVLKHN
jgi:hypothetical protein